MGQLGTQPRNRKETRERQAGGEPMPPGPWWEGHEPPRPGQERCGSWGWQPPRASSFAQDQVCLPEPIPGRASSQVWGPTSLQTVHPWPGSASTSNNVSTSMAPHVAHHVFWGKVRGRTLTTSHSLGRFLQVHEGFSCITPGFCFLPVGLPDQLAPRPRSTATPGRQSLQGRLRLGQAGCRDGLAPTQEGHRALRAQGRQEPAASGNPCPRPQEAPLPWQSGPDSALGPKARTTGCPKVL